MYCCKCGYRLHGLDRQRCPECGRPFDPADAQTFARTLGHRRARKTRKAVKVVAIIIIPAFIVITWAIEPPGFNRFSVCAQCGATQGKTEYYLPFTELTIYTDANENASPLSTVLDKHTMRCGHGCDHDWALIGGGGRGLFRWSCAIGVGDEIAGIAQTPQIAAFIDALVQYEGRAAAETWLDRLLTIDGYGWDEAASLVAVLPPNGFADEAAWKAWWRNHQAQLEAEWDFSARKASASFR